MKRNDLTKDPNHYDYIWNYKELDRKMSQLRLSELDTKTRCKLAKKQVIGDDDKPHNVWLEVCTEIYTAFDIETSTVFTKNIVDGKVGYYSSMYVAMFGLNNHCILFRTWNEVYHFFIKLPRLLNLSPCTVLLTWVHNLDYENSYIKHRFDIDMTTYFGKNKQHPIKYLLQNHFYFHDSYSVTNSSLKKLAEMYNTKHQKAVGDLDYNIARNSQSELSYTDIGYCACDVFVLCDFAKIMFDEFLKKRGYIPDTATQILSKEMQDNAVKYGKAFLGRRYDRIMQQYDDEKQQRHAILKSIHGKIFGFQYTTKGGAVETVKGIVDSHFFTPFDENEHQIPIEGKEIYGEWYYDFYEWLFRGGYTKSNARYTSTDTINVYGIQEPVGGYDYTSSYPFVQTICNYPMSEFREIKLSRYDLEKGMKFEYGDKEFENNRYIFILRFNEIQSIDDYSLESESKAHISGRRIIDNGRVHYADEMTVCLTDCDFALYRMYYKWKNMHIIKAWRSDAGKLPDYLLHTLWNNGLKKQTLKDVEGMEVEYMLSKAKFNSAYGLCCKQPVFVEYKLGNTVLATGYETTEQVNFKWFGRADVFRHSVCNYTHESFEMSDDTCKMIDFDDAVKSSILSPFWGIWTSAFARYNLLSCTHKVSAESEWITNDVVYMDTDSLYMINYEQHKHIIDEWNKFAAVRVLERLPEGYEPLQALGQFSNIAEEDTHKLQDHFDNFKTLGAKRYIKSYPTTKKKKHIKSIYNKTSVTIAGLPKGTLENFCKRTGKNIYEEFRDSLDFTIGDSPELVKLARTYHDELVKINVNGEIMTEYSSCTLYPNTFKLTMLPLYISFINGVLEGSGAKNYARGVKE